MANTLSGQNAAIGSAINPAVNNYTSNLYNVPTNADLNAKVANSPSSLTPEEQSAYKAQLGAASKAPNSANTFEASQGYQDLSGKIQNAVSQADLWNSGNSIPNISAALSPFEQAGTSSGNTTLDALLLSQSPGAYSQIQNAVAPAAGFKSQLGAGAATADKALSDAIANNVASSASANQSAGNYVSGLNQNLTQYLSKAQGDVGTYNQSINDLLSQEGNIQPLLGRLQSVVNDFNAQGPTGLIDVGTPLGTPATQAQPNIGQLATSQNYSDIAALQELLGPEAFAALNPAINPANAAQAGTYTAPGTIPSLKEIYKPAIDPALAGYYAYQNKIDPNLSQNYGHVGDALSALASALGVQFNNLPPQSIPLEGNVAPGRYTTNG